MITLNKPGGALREYRYVLTSSDLAGSDYPLTDLNALMVSGVQVVPHSVVLFNNTDGDLELPQVILNGIVMNIGTTLVRDVGIHYYCTGDTPPDFPSWNTGGSISFRWNSFSGSAGNVYAFLYVSTFPLSLLV